MNIPLFSMKSIINGGIVSAAEEISKITAKQSNFMKIWYITVACRIMVIYSVGQEIYSKEESTFECATKQFLCRTICYDQYMPINYTRFWIWHTHFLALVVVLFNWIDVGEKIACSRANKTLVIATLQSVCLLGIEIIFGMLLLFLLAKQHHPGIRFATLFSQGELFFSPAVYTCEIQKTFSEKERLLYFKRENVIFRKSPAGLRVKAQLACDQSDALCTIDRSTEKTIIVLCIILFLCLGIIALLCEFFNNIFKCICKTSRNTPK